MKEKKLQREEAALSADWKILLREKSFRSGGSLHCLAAKARCHRIRRIVSIVIQIMEWNGETLLESKLASIQQFVVLRIWNVWISTLRYLNCKIIQNQTQKLSQVNILQTKSS